MPRLRNAVSGVVVSVSDELAALLDSEWVDADKKAPAAKKAAAAPTDQAKKTPPAKKAAAKKAAAPAKKAAEETPEQGEASGDPASE